MRTNFFVLLFSLCTVGASAQILQKNTDSIRFRCSGTIAANDMLYVVDGVLSSKQELMHLSPADILSVDLLKESDTKIFSCNVQPKPVILITTKKANRKLFVVVDAKTNTGIAGASIHVTTAKTRKAIDFIADDFGRLKTDSLLTDSYSISVSATGYESLTISGTEARLLKYRLQLQPEFKELDEINIVAYRSIKCGSGYLKAPASKMEVPGGAFRCLAFGVSVSEENGISKKSVLLYQPKINIYPNPVTANGMLQLSFSELKPGPYQIRVLNNSGQLFYSFQMKISSKNQTEQFQLSNLMAAGLYMVLVADEKNKMLLNSKLIIQ